MRSLGTSTGRHLIDFTKLLTDCIVFYAILQPYFNYFAAVSTPIQAFHNILSKPLAAFLTMDSDDRGVIHVAMAIINPWKYYLAEQEVRISDHMFSRLLHYQQRYRSR